MSAVMEDTTTETPSSSEVKDALLQQLEDKRNAVQERETDEVDVREQTEDGEQVRSGSEEQGRASSSEVEEEEADHSEQEKERSGFKFTLDDEVYEVNPEAVFEFKADGKNVKMTLEEMRDAAAGGVAVRNRMRQLAEERKKLFQPYKDFTNISSKDPLTALKKVFGAIKQVDPKADMNEFLVGLGKQAQSLTQMSPSDRKAYELEKELNETRETLTEKERMALVQERKQELVNEGISEEQIMQLGEHLLQDPTLASSIKNEGDLFDRIEDLNDEIHRQQAVRTALHKYDSKIPANDPLVFELSTLLEKNPDFDEHDLEEIAEGVVNGVKKSKASKAVSKRRRSNVSKGYAREKQDLSKLPPKEQLKQQILNKRKSQHSTR